MFTFSEAIKLAADATITIRTGYQPGVTVALVGNAAVTLAGPTITVQLPQRLAYATEYTVEFSANAASDLAGTKTFGGSLGNVQFYSGLSPVAVNLTGTHGSDQLDGSDLADTFDGGAGFDVIKGHGGGDMLVGGTDPGSDAIQNNLHGGAGNDSLWGGRSDDQQHPRPRPGAGRLRLLARRPRPQAGRPALAAGTVQRKQ